MSAPHAAWPRITIVTPSYNQGCFLEQTIRSVLDQQYPNLEYMIVDGGSTDESVDIIKRYASALTWWVSAQDAGQSDAINKGFRRSSGALAAWLNADDYYLPGALHAAADAYRRQPGASFYFGNGLRVDRAGKPQGAFFAEGQVRFHRPALVWGLNTILQPAAFIQRDCLARVGYLDETLHYGMDSDLWLKLSALAPPEIIQQTLAASREYGEAKTSTGSFGRIEELRQIAAKYSGCAQTPGSLLYWADTMRRLALDRPDVYPSSFIADLDQFWAALSRLLLRFGAAGDGFPLAEPGPAVAPPPTGHLHRGINRLRRRVKRLVWPWHGRG